MRLFGNEQEHPVARLHPDEDHAGGVRVSRRRIVWFPVAAAAALAGYLPALGRTQEKPGMSPNTEGKEQAIENEALEELDWDAFLSRAREHGMRLAKLPPPGGHDAYLFAVASYAARLRLGSIPQTELMVLPSSDSRVHFGMAFRGVPFIVVEWWMEPNAVLPPHNHPNYSVCTLCTQGEVRIQNFEIDGEAPAFSSAEAFRVRQTRDELLGRGRITTLAPARDNIHTLRAGPAGARGLDITTLHTKDVGFSYLKIDDRPVDAARRTFEARWVAN